MSPARRLIVASSVMGLATACAMRPSDQPPGEYGNGKGTNGHWVYDARLREIMTELERNHEASWPQEIENEYAVESSAKAQRKFDDIELLARRLAETARRIPDAVAHISMPEVDRRSFLAQADTLYDQAVRLQGFSAARDLDQTRMTLSAIESTCDSCHRRFRDFSGPR